MGSNQVCMHLHGQPVPQGAGRKGSLCPAPAQGSLGAATSPRPVQAGEGSGTPQQRAGKVKLQLAGSS